MTKTIEFETHSCSVTCKVKQKPKKEQTFKPCFTSTEEVLQKLNSL